MNIFQHVYINGQLVGAYKVANNVADAQTVADAWTKESDYKDIYFVGASNCDKLQLAWDGDVQVWRDTVTFRIDVATSATGEKITQYEQAETVTTSNDVTEQDVINSVRFTTFTASL